MNPLIQLRRLLLALVALGGLTAAALAALAGGQLQDAYEWL